MKRILMLLFSALLLTGCTLGPLRLIPQSADVSEPKPLDEPQKPRVLKVYDPQDILKSALKTYSEQQGVEIRSQEREQAALAADLQPPTAETSKDLSAESVLLPLAAGMGTAKSCYGFPVGSASYGYLVDESILKALLGKDFDRQALKDASWKEWAEFVRTVDRWIESPRGQTVTLGGKKYPLPKQKNDLTQNLTGVFSVPTERAYSGAVLSPVLATQYKTRQQIAGAPIQEHITEGAVSALAEMVQLEMSSLTGVAGKLPAHQAPSLHEAAARQTFTKGKALFYRASTGETALFEDALRQSLVLIPIKFGLEAKDFGDSGCSMEQVRSQPVAVAQSWLSIPVWAEDQEEKEAQAFLLWLYTSSAGKALIPQNTDSPQNGLPDLSVSLLPEDKEWLENKVYLQIEHKS